MITYFAYGSNMDAEQMARRCWGSRLIGPAELPGYRLAFVGHSASWGGGVATVVPDAVGTVEGLLWEISQRDLEQLDRCEGLWAGIYRRRSVRCLPLKASGRSRSAVVYVCNSRALTPPSKSYLGLIERAYRAHGLDEALLRSAVAKASRRAPAPEPGPEAGCTKVFVYGTLRAGEANARLLVGAKLDRLARTEAAFDLADMGPYPAMVRGGSTAVRGEVYVVDEATLRALDRLEGHPRFYRRERITLGDGEEVEAYLMPPEAVFGRRRIANGDWCSMPLRLEPEQMEMWR